MMNKVNGSCFYSSAPGSDNSCSISRVGDTPSCSQTNTTGQITSLTVPQGHKRGRTIILHTMWRVTGEGGGCVCVCVCVWGGGVHY